MILKFTILYFYYFRYRKRFLHNVQAMNDCIRKVFKLPCVRDTDYVKSTSFVILTCISIARFIINTSIKCSIVPIHFCTNDREEYLLLVCHLYQRKFLLKHIFTIIDIKSRFKLLPSDILSIAENITEDELTIEELIIKIYSSIL